MKHALLVCGLIAGPVFIAANLIQAFTRAGFDLARHPISLLSLGSLGWLHIANFGVSGILCLLGAVVCGWRYDRVPAAPGVHRSSASPAPG
jgi:hypothetical protein